MSKSSTPRTRADHVVPGNGPDRRFQTIFEQSPVSTQIFTPDGETVRVNRAWEELWGVTLEQLGSYNVLEDQQLEEKGIMPYIKRGFAGETVAIPAVKYVPEQTVEVPGAVPYRWVRAFIYPVRDSCGAVSEIVLMHEDITEQRKAEEALQESEQRFRAMFYGAPVGISLIDRDGTYIAVNPARQRMLGYSEEDLIGKSYLDVTHPDDVEHDEQVNEEARTQGRDAFQLEKRFVRQNGETVWSRITAAVVRDDAGRTQYSISIAEDITAQKQAEADLAQLLQLERMARARSEHLAAEREAILGQIAEGIIITDPTGRIVFVNRRAEEIHGMAALDVPVDEYADVYHLFTMDGAPYPPRDLPLTRATLDGETTVDAEWIIRRRDGVEVIAQGSAAPVLADDGTRLGGVLTIRDVTAQHVLERQKDEFLSAVAHDLRTPLTTIKGRIQVLRLRKERGALQDRDLDDGLVRMDANATRMINLINELLDVANLQIGRPLNFVTIRTDLVQLVHNIVAEHRQVSDLHDIVVNTALTELWGTWDIHRLERVLSNLLSNAVKYSPRGGFIRVNLSQDDRDGGSVAVLSVTDQGIGIPVADLPHVFERFHRATNVAGAIPGTGIGLSAVKANVEQHGGTVAVESEEGKRTTFTIRLPIETER